MLGGKVIAGPSKEDAVRYLNDRKSNNFNTIIIRLIEHEFSYPGPPPKNFYGDEPFTTPGDFSTPNGAYFAHADWVIKNATDAGFLLLLTPAYLGFGGGGQGWYTEINNNGPTKMYNYGVYVGNRYKNYSNIIWVMGGDYAPNAALDEIRMLAQGIKDGGNPNWLFTVHNGRGQSGITQYQAQDIATWLNLSTTYTSCNSAPIDTINDYYRNFPFFFVEGIYENEGASPFCLRSQAYWSILTGSMGSIFGNNPVWAMGSYPAGTGSNWVNGLNSSGAQDMKRMYSLFTSRDWASLVPDLTHQVLIAGYGSNDTSYVAAGMAKNGNTFMAYDPYGAALTINMTKISGISSNAWWYNPRDGNSTLIGTYTNSGTRVFTPSSVSDWILVIDDAALNLPAPGTQQQTQQNSSDINSDGKINIIDLVLVIRWQGRNSGNADWNNYRHLDTNNDNKTDMLDVNAVIGNM